MIRLIAAIDNKRGLAKDGALPWDLPDDWRFFREHTKGQGGIVLMGRKTFDAIGRPLPDRRNIILSKKTNSIPGIETVNDLSILNTLSNVWIIGGEAVYKQTITLADELYLTHIEDDFQCDQFFPDYSKLFIQNWRSEIKEQNGVKFWYEILIPRAR